MFADVKNYRTQDWGDIPITAMWLHFQRTPLADREGTTSEPWGLTCGPLAIHPVFLGIENDDPDAAARFRVSARECGGAIADFCRLEIALGFAAEIMNLDWSGKREDAAAIIQRNGGAVLRSYRAWQDFSFCPEDAPE